MPQFGAAAFKLTVQEPNSDPIQVADGFYILHLTGVIEARPLTLEEAKPKIVDALKKSRTRELMSTKGAEAVNQLREATKSGQPLDAAIQKSGVKPEKIPPFSLIEEEKTKSEDKEPKKDEPADLMAIKDAVAFLNPGEISDFSPSGKNGLIAILEKRERLQTQILARKKQRLKKDFSTTSSELFFTNGCTTGNKRPACKLARDNYELT